MPINLKHVYTYIVPGILTLSGCAPGYFAYPYVRTESLLAACNMDAHGNSNTAHTAETVCNSYLSAVIDSLEDKRYRIKRKVCLPDKDELLQQAAEAVVARKKEGPATPEQAAEAAVEKKREDPATSENIAKVKSELQKEVSELGGSYPYLHDILVLYRFYTAGEPIYGWENNQWRIALHRTPFDTVKDALHEAWPCENFHKDTDGYHVIYGITEALEE